MHSLFRHPHQRLRVCQLCPTVRMFYTQINHELLFAHQQGGQHALACMVHLAKLELTDEAMAAVQVRVGWPRCNCSSLFLAINMQDPCVICKSLICKAV